MIEKLQKLKLLKLFCLHTVQDFLTISWSNKIDAGRVETNCVSATDILPTLTSIAGVELTDNTVDGINLLKPEADCLLVWKWKKKRG